MGHSCNLASSFSLTEDPLESKIGETKSPRPQTHHNRRKICGKHAKTSGAKDTGVLHARELLVATLSTRTRFRQQLQGRMKSEAGGAVHARDIFDILVTAIKGDWLDHQLASRL